MTFATETLAAERFEPLSQQAIAEMMGVSRSMIWIIEHRALDKIRRAIEREARLAGVTPREWLCGD